MSANELLGFSESKSSNSNDGFDEINLPEAVAEVLSDHGDGGDETGGRLVEHVVLVQFHHRVGNVVEFCHPPLNPDDFDPEDEPFVKPRTDDGQIAWPRRWANLPFLALPDGAHESGDGVNHSDCSFFILEPLTPRRSSTEEAPAPKAVYGVAVFGQVGAKNRHNSSSHPTRSSIQKALVVLLRVPVFGAALTRMTPIAQAFFDQTDLSATGLLRSAFASLNSRLTLPLLTNDDLHEGLSARELVRRFGPSVLTLFKLCLLERRLLFFSSPASDVCRLLITLLDLFPKFLHQLLLDSLDSRVGGDQSRLNLSDELGHGGLPLVLFHPGRHVFLPFVTLHDLDALTDSHASFVAGTSNELLKQRGLCDVLVDCRTGTLSFSDAQLEKAVRLTTADRRFMDQICQAVLGTTPMHVLQGSTAAVATPSTPATSTTKKESSAAAPDAVSLSSGDGAVCTAAASSSDDAPSESKSSLPRPGARATFSRVDDDSSVWDGSERYIRQHFRVYLEQFLATVNSLELVGESAAAAPSSSSSSDQADQGPGPRSSLSASATVTPVNVHAVSSASVLVCSNGTRNARRNPTAGTTYTVNTGGDSLADYSWAFVSHFLQTGVFAEWAARCDAYFYLQGHQHPCAPDVQNPLTAKERLEEFSEQLSDRSRTFQSKLKNTVDQFFLPSATNTNNNSPSSASSSRDWKLFGFKV